MRFCLLLILVSGFASISDEQFQCYPCTLITSEEANGEWLLWDALSAISLFILFLKISAFWPIRTRKFWFFFFCILVGWIYGSVMFILNCVIYPNLPKGIEDNHILLRSIDVLIGFMFFFFNKPHYFNVMWIYMIEPDKHPLPLLWLHFFYLIWFGFFHW